MHIHLEGSLTPATLCLLDRTLSLAEAEQLYRFQDFAGFIAAFKAAVVRLKAPADYVIAAAGLFESLAKQNVRYAEITLSAGVVLWKKQSLEEVWAAVREAGSRAPVEVRWVLDCVRQFGAGPAEEVASFAARHAGEGVVAFGIGGDEASRPASEFAGAIAIAKEAGLGFVPHAGETTDARNVWDMVNLGADRIGHGIRSVDDPELLAVLRERDIALEVCPSSNVCTGAVAGISHHPLRRLYDAGVPIVLGSDDPAMFRTSIRQEYETARQHFGFTEAEIGDLAKNSFRYGFHRAR